MARKEESNKSRLDTDSLSVDKYNPVGYDIAEKSRELTGHDAVINIPEVDITNFNDFLDVQVS